jgi:hypothetical protein
MKECTIMGALSSTPNLPFEFQSCTIHDQLKYYSHSRHRIVGLLSIKLQKEGRTQELNSNKKTAKKNTNNPVARYITTSYKRCTENLF